MEAGGPALARVRAALGLTVGPDGAEVGVGGHAAVAGVHGRVARVALRAGEAAGCGGVGLGWVGLGFALNVLSACVLSVCTRTACIVLSMCVLTKACPLVRGQNEPSALARARVSPTPLLEHLRLPLGGGGLQLAGQRLVDHDLGVGECVCVIVCVCECVSVCECVCVTSPEWPWASSEPPELRLKMLLFPLL